MIFSTGGKHAIRDLLTKIIGGSTHLSGHEGVSNSHFVSRSNSRPGLGSDVSLFSRNSNRRRKYRRPSRFSRGTTGGSNMMSRTNSRVSTLSQRSSIVSGCNNKHDLAREDIKKDNEELLSNASDGIECNDDDDDDPMFHLSHSSVSSLDSDMTERTDGTRRIQRVVRDEIKKNLSSLATRNTKVNI